MRGSVRRFWRYAILVLACGLLSACVTPQAMRGNGSAGEFSRVGRFSLTVSEVGGGQNAIQGGFSWFDNNHRYILDLTNPLGSTEARVEGVPGSATLTRSNGTKLSAADPDGLAEDALGSRVPVAGMRDWLRGRVPSVPVASGLTLDDRSRPVSFEQGGWRVRLSRYDNQGPCLLALEREEPGRRIVLRLVVNPS